MLVARVGFTTTSKPRKIAVFAALLFGLALCGGVLAVPSARASADTTGEHVCENIGNDGTTNAIICTDLLEESLGGNQYVAYAQTEAICTKISTGAYVECEAVSTFNETAKATSSGTDIASAGPLGCAVTDGASACSPNGRNYLIGDTNIFGDGCITNVWAVTEGGGLTGIELPSGTWKWMSSNFGTPHVNVGDDC